MLTLTKFGNSERNDEVSQYYRFNALIIGECSNVLCPTRFHIDRGKKQTIGTLKEHKDDEYLEYVHNVGFCLHSYTLFKIIMIKFLFYFIYNVFLLFWLCYQKIVQLLSLLKKHVLAFSCLFSLFVVHQ